MQHSDVNHSSNSCDTASATTASRNVRTIRLKRQNGFGFTILGQRPCVLSHVTPGSAAELEGLSRGNVLISINGQSVINALHDDVIRLINNAGVVLFLQITDGNAFDVVPHNGQRKMLLRDPFLKHIDSQIHFNNEISSSTLEDSGHHPTVSVVPLLQRALVSYVGKVDVVDHHHNCNVGSIWKAVSSLSSERHLRTYVIIELASNCVRLVDSRGSYLATYLSDEVLFSCEYPEDPRFFALLIRGGSSSDSPRSCCSYHVFFVDPSLSEHRTHATCAAAFRLRCTIDPASTRCREFPANPQALLLQLAQLSSVSASGSAPASAARVKSPRDFAMQPCSFKVPCAPQAASTSTQHSSSSCTTTSSLFRRWPGGSLRRKKLKVNGCDALSASIESLPNSGTAATAMTQKRSARGNSPNFYDNAAAAAVDAVTKSPQLLSAISEKNISQLGFCEAHDKKVLVEEDKRVARWATGLAKLLQDHRGIQIFKDFLVSEFSAENLEFWLAVEQYKELDDVHMRRHVARSIYSRFLDPDGDEPVNVDVAARSIVKAALTTSSEEDSTSNTGLSPLIFQSAQDHVFQLLRMDSYSRFLKSELYKQCLLHEMASKSLSSSEHLTALGRRNGASVAAEEEKRKRGFFPWMKTKGSKRLARPSTTVPIQTSSPSVSHEGRLDTASSGLCRVTFPDESTAVLNPKQMSGADTVGQVLQGLCVRRGFSLEAVEALDVDLDASASWLIGREVRLETRILFRVELMPWHTCVGVRARPGAILGDVLKPVLERYGLRAEALQLSRETPPLLEERASLPPSRVPLPHLSFDMDVKLVEGSKLQLFVEQGHSLAGAAESMPSKRDVTSKHELRRTDRLVPKVMRHSDHLNDANGLSDQRKKKSFFNAASNSTAFQSQQTNSQGLLHRFHQTLLSQRVIAHVETANISSAEDADSSANLSQGPRELLDLLDKISDTRLNDQRGKITDTHLGLPDFLIDKENVSRSNAVLEPEPVEDSAQAALRNYVLKCTSTPKVEAGKLLPRQLILNSLLEQPSDKVASSIRHTRVFTTLESESDLNDGFVL